MDARLDDVQRKQAFDVARSDAAFVGHQCRERPTELGRQRRITTQLDIEEDRAVLTQTVGEALANPIGHALGRSTRERSEEHTSELQSLLRISYAVFCLKKKNTYK